MAHEVPAAGRGSVGFRTKCSPSENNFTNRNTTFMTWSLLHLARMLGDAGGIPAHGSQHSRWDTCCRFDFRTLGHH